MIWFVFEQDHSGCCGNNRLRGDSRSRDHVGALVAVWFSSKYLLHLRQIKIKSSSCF